jgi:hypothetical protein
MIREYILDIIREYILDMICEYILDSEKQFFQAKNWDHCEVKLTPRVNKELY